MKNELENNCWSLDKIGWNVNKMHGISGQHKSTVAIE
jgi:hypothetical protein